MNLILNCYGILFCEGFQLAHCCLPKLIPIRSLKKYKFPDPLYTQINQAKLNSFSLMANSVLAQWRLV